MNGFVVGKYRATGGRFFSHRDGALCLSHVVRVNIFVEDANEFLDDFVSAQGGEQPAVYVDRGFRFLEGPAGTNAVAGSCGRWCAGQRKGREYV